MRYAPALLLVFTAVKGWGAITVTSTTFHGNPGAANPQTFSFNCNGGDLLVVAPLNGNSALATAVTFNSLALTQSTQTVDNGGPTTAAIWYRSSPPAGSQTVSITWGTAQSQTAAGVICFSGTNTTTPIDIQNCSVAGSGGGTVTVSLTTTVNNDTLYDSLYNNNTNALTSGSGTIQWSAAQSGNTGTAGATKNSVGIGANSMTYTATSFSQPAYCGIAIELAAAAAGGGFNKASRMERYE
jgi:hypothetical protein